MKWNWQQKDWGNFTYSPEKMRPLEDRFLKEAGRWQGTWVHLDEKAKAQLRVDLMSKEALQTSQIEGEILDRASVQASIRRLLGLNYERQKLKP